MANAWTKFYVWWLFLVSLDVVINDHVGVSIWTCNRNKACRSVHQGLGFSRSIFVDARKLSGELNPARSSLEYRSHAYNYSAKDSAEGQRLLDFRKSITSDPSRVLSNWTNETGSHCGWFGVTCDGMLGPVIALNLSGSQMEGSINFNALRDLSSLVTLDLSNNSFTGKIRNLNFTALEVLTLGLNDLSGNIPASLGDCFTLRHLDLSKNSFGGPIPKELGNLGNLVQVDLSGNSLRGNIPSALSNCSSLRELYLDQNHFDGEIGQEIGKLTTLEYFSATQNHLVGGIPKTLANCSFLKSILLDENSLMGTIPQNLGSLRELQYLSLERNRLDGAIPAGLLNSTALLYLDLSSNRLSGDIPSQLGQLQNIVTLKLHSNAFTGPIPERLSECFELKEMDLSANNLTGGIPSSLTSLQSLRYFNVSFNQLTGPVPDAGPFRNFTFGSYEANPGLCGRALQQQCGRGSRNRHLVWIVIVAAAAGLVASCLIIITCFFCWVYRKPENEKKAVVTTVPPVTIFIQHPNFKEMGPESVVASTNGFSSTSILGVGSRSTVHLGVLPDGAMIAVKRLQLADHENVMLQLHRELQRVLPLEHPNLLKVYGLFSTPDTKALVLEYMPQGTLQKQLYHMKKCSLTWGQRLQIALGVAEAMVHLHQSRSKPIIHLDLKPSNILLDDNMEPRVSDYAITPFLNHQPHADFSISSNVYGTIGYIPPEYGAMAGVSTKGDVYNFGVVLMELLTRKRPTDDMFEQERSLRSWVIDAYPERIPEILDSSLEMTKEYELLGAQLMLQLAIFCTRTAAKERPEMWRARNVLLQIISFQAPRKSYKDSAKASMQLSSE